MKIRTGYVSNSSSSSFVVAFDKIPETLEELRDMMFPNKNQTSISYYDNHTSIDQVVQQVFGDIKKQKPLSDSEIKEEISTGWFDGFPSYDKTDKPVRDFDIEFYKKFGNNAKWKNHPDWDKKRFDIINICSEAFDKDIEDAASKYYDKNKDKFEGKVCLKFEYCDNNGELFAIMEHGDIFAKIPHIQISHH